MVRCAIIAAFDGAGLRPVFRVPAARRLALVAARAGLDTACVIGRDDALAAVLDDLVPQDAFLTVADEADLRRAVAGLGLDAGDQVLVMAAGSVIDAWSLRKLLAAGDGGCDLYIAGDAKAPPLVCLVTGRFLYELLRAFLAQDGALPTGIAFERVPVGSGLPAVLGGGTDAKKDAENAERLLVGALGAATARTDSFFSRHIHRPLSRPISSRLAKTVATPNMFTLFHIAVGLAGAFFLVKGTYASQVAGGLLFLASTILDGVDGELARLKLQESNFGHYLDIARRQRGPRRRIPGDYPGPLPPVPQSRLPVGPRAHPRRLRPLRPLGAVLHGPRTRRAGLEPDALAGLADRQPRLFLPCCPSGPGQPVVMVRLRDDGGRLSLCPGPVRSRQEE